ncbi:formimidoylglutamase [Deferribacterales bacterium Es71-Z0220]|uniref:formimidoylglutamase n=1 Tax=Deferrivibrio essentukiensis TaxID=2880922 RepID=UPI001F623C05|nr:formimidoylglutamase [Deferrivibrio essentukiensis]
MAKYINNLFEWKGRVDSADNRLAFRWHQVISNIDLMEADFDLKNTVVIIGFCCDEGVKRNKGRIGAKDAPKTIRNMLSSLPWHFDKLKICDAGDIVVDEDLEKGQALLGSLVKKIKDFGGFPVVLGGGHEVAYGTYKGIKEHSPAIINFDAHFDNRPFEDTVSSGTMFAQIAAETGSDYRYFCLGVQNYSNTKELFKRNMEFGGKFLEASHVKMRIMDSTFQSFVDKSDRLYVTVCMDVFSQAYACGVSAPNPFGICPDDFEFYAKEIFWSGKVTAFDIAEVNPAFDFDNQTSRLAAGIVFKVAEFISNWGYK